MRIADTARLRLRELELDDAPFILELVNEPGWLRHIGDKHVATVEDATRYITNSVLRMYERYGFGLYLVESKDGREALGICGLVKRDSLDCPDLGFAFLERHWNHGYASEAARGALTHGRSVLGLARVLAIVSNDNQRSTRLLARLGFRFIHQMRIGDGDEVDVYCVEDLNAFMRGDPMNEQSNVALARRWFTEVWNERLDATVHELLDPQAVGYLEGLVSRGIPKFFEARSYILGAFPDFELTIEDMIAEGDSVVARWSAHGTHRGENLGIPATGTRVHFRGMTWLRFANGRIIEGWDSWNQGRLVSDLQVAAQRNSAESGATKH